LSLAALIRLEAVLPTVSPVAETKPVKPGKRDA